MNDYHQMDWESVCGSPSLIVWDRGNFGPCFSQLVLDLPSAFILSIISAYYIGKEYNWVIRDGAQLAVLTFRTLLCLTLALTSLANLIIELYTHQPVFLAEFITTFITTFSWLAHSLYITVLKQRVSRSLRGPLLALSAWLVTVIPTAFRLKRLIVNFDQDSSLGDPLFWLDISRAVLQFFYLLSLIPHGMANVTGFDASFQSLADQSLNQRLLSNYNRFSFDRDPYYLGVAREGVTFLSRLFLSWVQPLMVKGNLN